MLFVGASPPPGPRSFVARFHRFSRSGDLAASLTIGYLLKDTQAEALCQAIKVAAAGQVQLTPRAAARLMQAISAPESPEALTERETDVLRLLSQGHSNKQIAHSLNNTEKTIKTHVSRILAKLGVQSRTQATLYAIRTGMVSPGSTEQAE